MGDTAFLKEAQFLEGMQSLLKEHGEERLWLLTDSLQYNIVVMSAAQWEGAKRAAKLRLQSNDSSGASCYSLANN